MTQEQIDILLKHRDIIRVATDNTPYNYFTLPGHVVLTAFFKTNGDFIEISDQNYLRQPTRDFIETYQNQKFAFGELLENKLNEIFNWYVEKIRLDGFKGEISTRITDLQNDKTLILQYLRESLLTEFKTFDQLRENGPFESFERIEELKNCWNILIENEHLISVIEYLKFHVFEGKKLPAEPLEEKLFSLFEQYFYSEKLMESYSGMELEKKIRYLQEKISELGNENINIPGLNDEEFTLQNEQKENDLLLETIESWLSKFKEIIMDDGYNTLINALKYYFTNGIFPKMNKKIKVGKTNKKHFGWALNQIYRSQKSNPLPVEYLLFAKENISLFADVDFAEIEFTKSNLYKYFTEKPRKL